MATQIYSAPGVGPYNPSILGGSGTTTFMFPAPSGAISTTVGTTSSSPSMSTSVPSIVGLPANGQFEGVRFNAICSGRIYIHGTSPTMKWYMYNGTSMTAASDGTALVYNSTAVSGLTTAATYPWTWATTFQGDSTSGILQVVSSVLFIDGGANNGVLTLTGVTSGFNAQAAGPVNISGPGYTYANQYATNCLNLVVGIQFTVTDALNKAYMNQWYVEA